MQKNLFYQILYCTIKSVVINLSLVSATQDDENCARNNTLTKLVFVFTERLLAVAQFLGSILRRVVTWLK